LLLFYSAYLGWTLARQGLFDNIGVDYRSFRASAQIARTVGFSKIYDLDVQSQFQRPIYDSSPGPWLLPSLRFGYEIQPFVYPAVFVVPLLPFSFGSPVAGLVSWTIVSLFGMVLYFRRFQKAIGACAASGVLAALLLSFPAFTNTFYGQVNVLLLIAAGEVLLAGLKGDDLAAGLWLGGFLLKPQLLVVIVPGLLLSRSFRTLRGLAFSAAALLGSSLLLAGPEACLDNLRLMFAFGTGMPSNSPQVMMNWRALGGNLQAVLGIPGQATMAIVGGGMILTFAAALWLWRTPSQDRAGRYGTVILATLAATTTIAWHSHIHMALLLFAPLLYLQSKRILSKRLLLVWALLPSVLFFALLPAIGPWNSGPILGFAQFALNSWLLLWARRAYNRTSERAEA
jgi:hypothetical protein